MTATSGTGVEWIVVLEFRAADGGEVVDLDVVQALVAALAPWRPVALYHPDRFALQLEVCAAGTGEALSDAVDRYEEAAGPSVCFRSQLTRAEVVARPEFEWSWDQAATGDADRRDDSLVCPEVYLATRALLGISTAEEAGRILAGCVTAIGAAIYLGLPDHSDGLTVVDISVVPGTTVHAAADAFSVAGMILERWVPPLVDDARRRLELLGAH